MVGWTRRKRASAINCEAANRDILLRSGSKRRSSELASAGGQQPSAARGRKRAKVFSSPSRQSSSSSLGYPNNEVNQSILKVGSRVLVTHGGSILKATIRKRRYEKNQHEFLIHYDGNKKSTLSWIPLKRISDVLENDDLGSEPPLSNKKRKRGQSASSDGAEEEQSGAHRKKSGCSVQGCRNPIAGCPKLAKMGVCWFHHGEIQPHSSPPSQNLGMDGDAVFTGRAGRAIFNEPEMVVSAQKEVSSSSCSHDGCANKAQRGGTCRRHGGKQIRRKSKHKTCSHEGCSNQAINGGVCIRHGAKRKKCTHVGCTNQAQTGGVCIRHGAKKPICRYKGCTNQVVKGGVCVRHGAKVTHKLCSRKGCISIAQRGGVCSRHGAKKKVCSHKGCTNIVIKGGVCWKHGANKCN